MNQSSSAQDALDHHGGVGAARQGEAERALGPPSVPLVARHFRLKFLREQLGLAHGREEFLHHQLSERTAAETQLRMLLATASRPALEAAPAGPEREGVRQVVSQWFRSRWWKVSVATGLLAALAGTALFLAEEHSFAGDTPVHHGRAPH